MPVRSQSRIIWQDGIIQWINGPEWDDVALKEFTKSAVELENLMKANAPWEDRTGNARDGLTATADNNNGIVEIALSNSVDYGFWLEVIQNGRFAIITPTLEQEAHRVTYNAVRRIRTARRGQTFS